MCTDIPTHLHTYIYSGGRVFISVHCFLPFIKLESCRIFAFSLKGNFSFSSEPTYVIF